MILKTVNGVVAKVPSNQLGTDWVVGDLHGCYDQFMHMMELINFNIFTDRMFSVGDLVDRGPKSFECLDLVFEPWFFPVKANHEQLMIDALVNQNWVSADCWFKNGGSWYNEDRDRATSLAHSIVDLPYIIAVGEGEGRFNVVHAEILAYVDFNPLVMTDLEIDVKKWSHSELDNLIWGRHLIHEGSAKGGRYQHPRDMSITYCGHTPVPEPIRVEQQLYIDTGLCFERNKTRALTIVDATRRQVYSWSPTDDTLTSVPVDEIGFEGRNVR